VKVIVIGAGVGGLTLAQRLRQAGIDVAVYERDKRHGRPQGISLHCDDRAASALRGCLPPEHVAMVESTMGALRDHNQSVAEVDGEFTVVGTQALNGMTPIPRPGRPANRPLLRSVLLAGLEDTVRFDAEFAGFEQQADGTVKAQFVDGSTDIGDVLVGADGVGSRVRRQYLPHVQLIDTGKRMLMGATPLRTIFDTALLEVIDETPTAVMRADGTILTVLSVLRYGQPPVAARDQWLPTLLSTAVTEAEDYVMWAMPASEDRVDSAVSPEAVWGVARELAAAAHPTLRLIFEEAWPQVTAPLRIGVTLPMPPWATTPVTVIGDAIHAAPGVGGNKAMQDAHRLGDALVRADRADQDLLAAIGSYEDAMRQENFPAIDAVGAIQPDSRPEAAPTGGNR